MVSSINRLTDKKLKALTVGGHDREYTLSDGGGLMIRVSKNGVISWFYQYKLEGRISKVSRPRLGRYPDMTLAMAREMRNQCRKWLAEGKDPQRMLKLDREASLKPTTVKDAIEYWLVEYVDGNIVKPSAPVGQVRQYMTDQWAYDLLQAKQCFHPPITSLA